MSVLRVLLLACIVSAPFAGAGEDEAKKPETKAEQPAAEQPPVIKDFDPKDVVGKMPEYPLKNESLKEVLDDYNDETEARQIEAHVMVDIFEALRATSQDELEKQKSATTYIQLMKDPAAHRGEIVALSGVLHNIEESKVRDNRTGVTKAWFGQIANAKRQIISFVSLEPLPEDVKVGKAVDLTGVFMKRYAYINRQPGDKLTWCPLVFVRKLERATDFDKPQAAGTNPIIDIVGGIVFLMIAIACFFYVWGRQKSKNAKANYFSQFKSDRSGEKAGLFPTPKPPPKAAAAKGATAKSHTAEPPAKPDAPPEEKKE